MSHATNSFYLEATFSSLTTIDLSVPLMTNGTENIDGITVGNAIGGIDIMILVDAAWIGMDGNGDLDGSNHGGELESGSPDVYTGIDAFGTSVIPTSWTVVNNCTFKFKI